MRKLAGDLGPLERDIMEYAWDREEAVTVREVMEAVGTRRDLAYTTVMTVMSRLWKKGLLTRGRIGRAYVYAPRGTREDHTARVVGSVLAGARDRRSVLLGFVRSVGEEELAELERLIRQARREGRSGRRR